MTEPTEQTEVGWERSPCPYCGGTTEVRYPHIGCPCCHPTMLMSAIRELENTIRALQVERAICHGTVKETLDGKPVPGTINDGTDAACPGYWRGHDEGVAGAAKQILKVLDDGKVRNFGSKELTEVVEKIRTLQAENARLKKRLNDVEALDYQDLP